jgi:type 1 glutamine amidotransferase
MIPRLVIFLLAASQVIAQAPVQEPIKALLVTGGCCHDYFFQADALTRASRAKANITWTVIHEGDGSTDHKASLYDDADWATGFDVVVHNECFAKVTDEPWIEKIADAHAEQGVPAVVIHCAMHTYRDITANAWRQFLGVTSKHHEHQSNKIVKNVKPDHPIMQGFPKVWTSPMDELYIIEKVWPNTIPLAMGVSDKEGTKGVENVAFWVNEHGKARVFGTTFGHSTETFMDKVFLDTVTRGMLWACDKIQDNGDVKTEYAPKPSRKRKPKKKK